MSRSERRKGAEGELEAAKVLRAHGIDAHRIPNSGGLRVKGDLTGIPGYHFEVKRQETIRLGEWLRQAADECEGKVPVVAHRTNRSPWYATLPLDDLARLLELARLTA